MLAELGDVVGRKRIEPRPAPPEAFEAARRSAAVATRRQRDFERELMAEIGEGESDTEPRWYALTITPGYERIAFTHLAARRFGVYLPMVDELYVERGCYRVRVRLIVPGYLFIASLGLTGRWRRPLHVPGVTGYVYRSGADRTRDEPAPIPQRFVDKIRGQEAYENQRVLATIRRPEDDAAPLRRNRAGTRRAKERERLRAREERRELRRQGLLPPVHHDPT